MPRGTTLTVEERARILTYRECGTTIRKIAEKLNRAKTTTNFT